MPLSEQEVRWPAIAHAADIFPEPAIHSRADLLAAERDVPLVFIENVGQFGEAALFYVPGPAGNRLWLTDEGFWLTLVPQSGDRGPDSQPQYEFNLKLSFPGANPEAQVEPFGLLNTQVSYLNGHTTAGWRTDVPVWRGVRYRDFYPGLNLELSGLAGQLQWRLVPQEENGAIKPPPDLEMRLRVEGAEALHIDGDQLRLTTPLGVYTLPLLELVATNGPSPLPKLSQPQIDGDEVIAPFVQSPSPSPSPSAGARPAAQTSAYLVYSAFLGGDDDDCFQNCVVTVDGGGSAYIAGYTRSRDFPTRPGVFERQHHGETDLFIAKVNLDGDELAYATFIGGSGADYGTAIAVDREGNAYLTGYTASSDFPTTQNAFQPAYRGGYADAFVVKLNANGTDLIYATFLGGENIDQGAAIAIDRLGNAYLTGQTQSNDFPFSTDAYQTNRRGGTDAFIVKLAPEGNQLDYATFLGGKDDDDGRAIAVDPVGNAYITGRTASTDFPTTADAFGLNHRGVGDAFVVKINPAGTDLIYATLLGGEGNDQGNGLAIDTAGNAYVVGSTLSGDFPITGEAFDRDHNEGYDVFVVKLNEAGTGLTYATFLGGSGGDRGYAIAVDGNGDAYVTGYTYSPDFPTTGRAVDLIHAGDFADAFVVKLNAAGTGLLYATFLGGDDSDFGTAIAVDGEGSAYVVGATQSDGFPITRRTFDDSYGGAWDGFVAKLAVGNEQSTTIISGVVRDRDGYAVPDVVVSAGVSGSATTDANGVYSLIGLEEGIYTLTPIKEGYTFSPPRRTVTVPSSEGMQVFTGVVGENPPPSFIDLPFDYGGSVATFIQALRDVDEAGWITSWFDHAYPDYNKNRNLMIWDGHTRTKGAYNLSVGCYERRCYDDHNGIDFAYRGPNQRNGVEIRAAAAGEVVLIHSGCRVGDLRCGNGYGNHVILYHEGGYFTLYAHLDQVTVSQGHVEGGQRIGTMGSTGNSSGPHLHFGLYRDNGNGVWDEEEIDKPVDPFGWRGGEGDPWVIDRQGPISHYVWRYPLSQVETFAGEQGTSMKDATGGLQVDIPPQAFSGEVTLELFLGSVSDSRSDTRSLGYPFWLRLLEWLPHDNLSDRETVSTVASALDHALTRPVTITATYADYEVSHLDLNQLAIAHWHENSQTWEALPTSIDLAARRAMAQTTALGDFDLQAPLICPADFVEPDDAYFAARAVVAGEDPAGHLFDIAADEDWFYLEAEAGVTYIIQTLNLAPGVDTLVEIYSLDSETLLASNDNSQQGLASYLEWRSPDEGFYFIRVSQAQNSVFGCNASYELSVTKKPYQIYMPLVIK